MNITKDLGYNYENEITNIENGNRWKSITKELNIGNIQILNNYNNKLYVINGSLKNNFILLSKTNELFLHYKAANPTVYNSSFSGSALPYPNEDIAFEKSKNEGLVRIKDGKFSFTIQYPNSYYVNMGSIYVPPEVKICILSNKNIPVSNIQIINLGYGVPFRSLTFPPERKFKGSLHYLNKNQPLNRSQYDILLSSGYPEKNVMPNNFWGEKPPK